MFLRILFYLIMLQRYCINKSYVIMIFFIFILYDNFELNIRIVTKRNFVYISVVLITKQNFKMHSLHNVSE